jgi:DoxX-like protein
MVTIRLLGAESNGINNYCVDGAGLQRWSSRSESHLTIQRERRGQSGHRQAALLYGHVLNKYDMALLKNELRSLAYEVILAEGLRDLTMAQRLALTMFYRNLHTHEAIEILLKQKLVEDALLAAMVAFSGLGKLRLDPRIVRIIHEVIGVPLKYFPLLAACEFVGALGLVLGIWWPSLGVAAGIGLVLYFVGAIVSHVRVGDVKGMGPVAFMLTVSVAALALRILTQKLGSRRLNCECSPEALRIFTK